MFLGSAYTFALRKNIDLKIYSALQSELEGLLKVNIMLQCVHYAPTHSTLTSNQI